MENIRNLVLAFTAMTVIGSTSLLGQSDVKTSGPSDVKPMHCYGKMWHDIPDLTQDQIKKIEDLRIAHLKEVNQIKNQLTEKRAHLNTLQSSDKVDNTAINKTIDDITSLQNELMKKKAAHRQSIRNLLTEKQKVIFDAKHDGKHSRFRAEGKMKGYGPYHKNNRRMKKCHHNYFNYN